jgi:2-amino-4-hydroxy-6-hydroxymethyldihydropteridine diphosphokinase
MRLLIVPLNQYRDDMQVFLLTGSNKGNRLKALARAYHEISLKTGRVVAFSSIYETEPWGFQADMQFLNQVIQVDTSMDPFDMITSILDIEVMMGRKREDSGYQSREIDIDILLYSDRIIELKNLQIPHPRLHLRKFVLEPLAELEPEICHPIFNMTIRQLLGQCPDLTKVSRRYDQSMIPSLFKMYGKILI